MLITSVSRSDGGNEYTVFDDTGSKYVITGSDLKKIGIPFTGREEDYPFEISDYARDTLDFCHLKLRCIKYLQFYVGGYGEKSKRKLLEKCRDNDYTQEVAEAAIEVLCLYGVIDEVRNCERLSNAYARDKLYGRYRIRQELYAKGFERQSVSAALENSETDFYENAVIMYRKLLKKYKGDEAIIKRKLADKMAYYGYSFDEIRYAADTVLSGSDDDESFE